jgi:hypothetical protein
MTSYFLFSDDPDWVHTHAHAHTHPCLHTRTYTDTHIFFEHGISRLILFIYKNKWGYYLLFQLQLNLKYMRFEVFTVKMSVMVFWVSQLRTPSPIFKMCFIFQEDLSA